MKTVKEVSMITGVSIRTLRYYDEIGLLKPTELTETGYRLYDNKALEKLQEIVNHTLECMSKENIDEQVQKFGSLENYKEYLSSGFANEQAMADLMKWYGSKEKAMEAIMQSTGDTEEIKQEQDENIKIYKLFMSAKECDNMDMERSAVELLAENYKKMFALDNARSILLDLSKEYLQNSKLAEVTDSQFGIGCSEYVANAIKRYYGV